jgi:hypothetical protein
MALRDQLRRLKHDLEGEMLVIPQMDGTVKRFPPSAGIDAYMNMMDRLGAGENAPPEHPLIEAARNSSDPKWSKSFLGVEDPDEWVKPIEDLSEP